MTDLKQIDEAQAQALALISTSPTLGAYLEGNFHGEVANHTLSVSHIDANGVHFYIHPQGVDGQTPNFVTYPESLSVLPALFAEIIGGRETVLQCSQEAQAMASSPFDATLLEGLAVSDFEFELNDEVIISVSGEEGEIIGRAEYLSSENTYLVRYQAADGRAVEAWWQESALELLEEPKDEGGTELSPAAEQPAATAEVKPLDPLPEPDAACAALAAA